jgi:hypothetical protein
MNLLRNIALSISGGIVVGSILIARIGLGRSAISKRSAATLAGVGAGIGVGIFIFYGVSNGDLIGSIITGIIIAFTVGFSIIIPNRWWR